jgi:WhiB family transcriptional regulator, redox-sensing transcriptional regulator
MEGLLARDRRPLRPAGSPEIAQEARDMSHSWREFARCRGVDPEIFYPASDDDADTDAAKAICAHCPVREACLEHALTAREREGIWGGLTERERRRILRRRRKSA